MSHNHSKLKVSHAYGDAMERLAPMLAEVDEKSSGGRIISSEALWSQFWKYLYLTIKDKIKMIPYL